MNKPLKPLKAWAIIYEDMEKNNQDTIYDFHGQLEIYKHKKLANGEKVIPVLITPIKTD